MKKLKDALLKAKSLALKMKLVQRLGTFCLAAVIAATSLVSAFPMTASAATQNANVSYYSGTSGWGFDFYRNGNGGLPPAYDPTPGKSTYSINFFDKNGWSYYTSGGKVAYCVKIGGEVNSGDTQTVYNLGDFYPNMTQQRRMRSAVIYSFKGTSKYGGSKAVELAASQCLIWILSANYSVSSDWAKGTSSGLATNERIFLEHIWIAGSQATNHTSFMNCYKKLRQDVMSHYILASNLYDSAKSANGNKIKLKYNSGTKTIDGMKSEGYWYATVNMGTYRSCFDYSPINNLKGVSVTESGNNITIYAS